MRGSRLLIVVLTALAVAGCLRRESPYQYVYAPPPGAAAPAPVYQTQVPLYQAQTQAPAYQAQGAATTPAPRGLFAAGGAMALMPVGRRSSCGPQGCAPPSPPAPMLQAAAYPAYQPPVPAPAAYAAQVSFESPYTLDAGDRLRITVFGQEGLTNSYAVDAAGNVTLPLIATVPARGLTTAQLSQSVSERLRQGYIREPHVAIEIEAYRPFFIHGEVATPGQYPYVANMTVENAVAIAGGFGPRADKGKVTLSRSIAGQTLKATVGLSYPLRPGDTLRVQERWF